MIETHRARFVLICFCHSVFLGISSPGLIYKTTLLTIISGELHYYKLLYVLEHND